MANKEPSRGLRQTLAWVLLGGAALLGTLLLGWLSPATAAQSSGNTSKPASCGHFKTGQSRVADARYLTVPPGEARGLRSAI